MIGYPIFFAVFFYTGLLPSYLVWKGDMIDWLNEIVFCGVKKVSYTITRLSRKPEEWNVVQTWEHFWFGYWAVMIKYINPSALTFLIVYLIKSDSDSPYGGYEKKWQLYGAIVPLLGFISFAFGMFFNL